MTSDGTVSVLAYGNTAGELAADAIDQAREFFGPAAELRVVGTWTATKTKDKARGEYMASLYVTDGAQEVAS